MKIISKCRTSLFLLFILMAYGQLIYGQMVKLPFIQENSNNNCTIVTASNNDLISFWVSNNHLYKALSSNNGVTWSDTTILDTFSNYDVTDIRSILLSSGKIMLIYNCAWEYRLKSSIDNGHSWGSYVHLITSGSGNISLSESLTGKVFMTYSRDGVLYYKTSNDNQLKFGGELTFSQTGSYSSIVPVSQSKLMMIYQNGGIYGSVSTDDGITWGAPTLITNNISAYSFTLGISDQTGKLWLFYQTDIASPFNTLTQSDILYKTSSDSGINWSDPVAFTGYKGYDGTFTATVKGNYPLVTFYSNRGDSLRTTSTPWFGFAGITNDDDAPPYVNYIYSLPNLPSPQRPITITAYVDDNQPVTSVILNPRVNGTLQSPLPFYDDGTHGDSLANDKKYVCIFPGLGRGDTLSGTIYITNQLLHTGVYSIPVVIVPETYNGDSVFIDVNRFKFASDNKGILGYSAVNNIKGGMYDGLPILYSGGFYLSGVSNGNIWSNRIAPSDGALDYQAGPVGSDPADPHNILYVVKSTDIPFGKEWQDWKSAVAMGADFYDGNHDGIYNPVDLNGNGKWDPNEDRPGLLGDITTWCVYNDGVPSPVRYYRDVEPQGVEIQQTIFAQKDSAELNNVIFIKYTLINKSNVTTVLDSVYFGTYTDFDIGSPWDDLLGSDTISSGMYTYNHGPDYYYGINPPSGLVELLQGPAVYIPGKTFTDVNSNGKYDEGVDIPLDTAYNRNGPILGITSLPGAINLGLTSSIGMQSNYPRLVGEPPTKEAARNNLLGGTNEGYLPNPCIWPMGQVFGENCLQTNKYFWYSGNPISQTGWLNNLPDENKQLINMGPFKLVQKVPVEILVAYMAGRGTDAYNSVSVVKDIAAATRKYYSSNFPHSIITGIKKPINQITGYQLYQNYPNPFNPSTIMKYDLAKSGRVKLSVYDILGREVAVLANEEKPAGNYSIQFDAGKYKLSSGVYFYRIESGDFISVKKFVLLK